MNFAFGTPSVSRSSLTVLASHCELHLYFRKNIFSQHQPPVFTNIGKASVKKQKSGAKLSMKPQVNQSKGPDLKPG